MSVTPPGTPPLSPRDDDEGEFVIRKSNDLSQFSISPPASPDGFTLHRRQLSLPPTPPSSPTRSTESPKSPSARTDDAASEALSPPRKRKSLPSVKNPPKKQMNQNASKAPRSASELYVNARGEFILPIDDQESEFGLNLNGLAGRMNTIHQIVLNGRAFPLIQQPPTNKSCGTAALMMAYLSNRPLSEGLIKELPDSFCNWYTGTGLTNGEDLMDQFRDLGVAAKQIIFKKEPSPRNDATIEPAQNGREAVAKIKAILSTPQKTMILSITHHILEGHWVVINYLGENQFLLRDPYSGRGFQLTGDDLAPLLMQFDSEDSVVLQ